MQIDTTPSATAHALGRAPAFVVGCRNRIEVVSGDFLTFAFICSNPKAFLFCYRRNPSQTRNKNRDILAFGEILKKK
jgi:hypothetical protein